MPELLHQSTISKSKPATVHYAADLTEDLKTIDVPTLIMHGDDDQIVPITDSALLSAKIVKNATLKVYEDLLAFIKA